MSLVISFLWKYRAAVLCVLLVSVIAGWRADHNAAADRETALTYQLSVETEIAKNYSKVNTGLIGHVSEQNAEIKKLITAGEALRVELSKKFEQFEAEKRDLLKQIAALPPLPADCESAVREMARSLKAMTGGK